MRWMRQDFQIRVCDCTSSRETPGFFVLQRQLGSMTPITFFLPFLSLQWFWSESLELERATCCPASPRMSLTMTAAPPSAWSSVLGRWSSTASSSRPRSGTQPGLSGIGPSHLRKGQNCWFIFASCSEEQTYTIWSHPKCFTKVLPAKCDAFKSPCIMQKFTFPMHPKTNVSTILSRKFPETSTTTKAHSSDKKTFVVSHQPTCPRPNMQKIQESISSRGKQEVNEGLDMWTFCSYSCEAAPLKIPMILDF